MSQTSPFPGDTPPPRPLHIEPREEARVTIDGPALCIERPDAPESFIPLRRISRIHFSPLVEITTAAILACARRGIVLVLHDQGEDTVARIIGRATELTRLRQRLLDLTEIPHWHNLYEDWKRSTERRICSTLRNRLDSPWGLKSRPHAMRAWIRQQAILIAGPQEAERTRRIFRQQSHAWMQSRLLDHGIGAENELWTIGDPDLARDLAELLALRVETLRIGWLKGRSQAAARNGQPLKPLPRRAIVARFEQKQSRIARLGDDLINRLHRWLVEIE